MRNYKIGITTKSKIIAQLLVFNCVLLPLSLLNFTIIHFSEMTVFILRGISFFLLLVLFFSFYARRVKIPKYYLILLFVSSLQLAVFRTTHKYFIDIILLLNFSLVYYNLNSEIKNYFLGTVSFFYFFIIMILIILQFAGVNIYSSDAYDVIYFEKGSTFGFINPNNLSYFIFVTNLLFYKTNNFQMFWISSFVLIFTYFFTVTQSTIIGLGIFIIYNLIIKYYKGNTKKLLAFSIFGFILTIVTGYYYINVILEMSFGTLVPRVNDIIKFKNLISSDFKTLLFGGYTANFDCFFTNYILGVGIISFIILFSICIITARKMLLSNDYFGYFLIMIILTLGLIENILLAASPLSILFIGTLFTYERINYKNSNLPTT